MIQNLTAYFVGLVVMGVLDGVWLTFVTPILYKPRIGELLRETPVVWAAIAFYLLYQAGVLVLAVRPALASGSLPTAAMRGAMLGLVAYATYDLTNNATLKIWSPVITAADMAWGTLITAIAATAACAVASRVS